MSTSGAGSAGVRFDYSGASVLVTGGTSGIGAAVAAAYQQAGAEVTIAGTRARPTDYDADLSAYRYLRLDVRDAAQITAVAAALPRLDILVHSGGVPLAGLGMDEYEPDNFELAVRMHLTGVYRLSRAFLDKLAASRLPGGASVVGIASMSAYFGVKMVPGYGAAKAGLVQLMKTMAVAWSRHGVRANAVAAGLIRTPQTERTINTPKYVAPKLARTPLGRPGEPAEVAAAVLFLTSAAAAYITGQTLPVDGGFSIAG